MAKIGTWRIITNLQYFTQLLSMTQGCVMNLTHGHISKVKVTVHTYPKPCPGHNSSLPCSILIIIYHTIVSWTWIRPFRVISQRSRSQFTHGENLFPDHYHSLVTWMGMILHSCCPWPRGCCCGGYLSHYDMSSYICSYTLIMLMYCNRNCWLC